MLRKGNVVNVDVNPFPSPDFPLPSIAQCWGLFVEIDRFEFMFVPAHGVAQGRSVLREERRRPARHLGEQLRRRPPPRFGQLYRPFVPHGHDPRAGQELDQWYGPMEKNHS